MFTLNPGPSQLSPETRDDIRRAVDENILEMSHRSKRFTDVSRSCIHALRTFLKVPDGYRIFYFDSATHVWHSLVANAVAERSFHFVYGAFSEKAHYAAHVLGKQTQSQVVPWGSHNDFEKVSLDPDTELISVCYNETSTGVKVLPEEIRLVHTMYPDALLAIDVTSCAGAVPFVIPDADIWYFSVQKCFGLPAGLAIAIISERAYERSRALQKIGKNMAGAWTWEHLDATMRDDKHQTPHTPNVLNIFLLGQQCERWNAAGGVLPLYRETLRKKDLISSWLAARPSFSFFADDDAHRSDTVITIAAPETEVAKARAACADRGITLGAGYGKIKKETFRIANFPAITQTMLKAVFEQMK